MDFNIRTEEWPTREPFRISGYVFHAAKLAVVEIYDGKAHGRGEACGVYYKNDTADKIKSDIEGLSDRIREGIDRAHLQTLVPPGGARNALDCALWELEARKIGDPAWQLAGLSSPQPLKTAFTVGAADPEHMAARAQGYIGARLIKLKLTGDDVDADRVQAVRHARPDVEIAIDANQGFTPDSLDALMPIMVDSGVILIEQPFPIGRERDMVGLNSPIPMAADESVQDSSDLEALVGLFDMINIKLDKCGGLTHGLEMAHQARKMGFKVMVGNMTGTSWSQAPAFILGQLCDFVDLDGPLFLAQDRTPAIVYEDGFVWCAENIWGNPHSQ